MFAGKTQKAIRLCACVFACVCERVGVCVLVHATQCLIMVTLGNAERLADPHQFQGLCDG